MGKVFHVQSIFEENCDIDEVGCIDENRSATAESTCAASQEEEAGTQVWWIDLEVEASSTYTAGSTYR